MPPEGTNVANIRIKKAAATRQEVSQSKVRVSIRDDEIVLNDFHESDPDVVALARQAENPEAAVHHAFEVGARAIKLAQLSQDAQIVETAFNDLRAGFDGKLDQTLREIDDATAALFGEDDGAVTRVLDEFRSEFEELLGDAFDPDSKRSIVGKFDALVRGLRKEDRVALREVLDPGNERSPLHRLQRDLTKTFRDEAKDLRALMSELSEKVAVRSAEYDLLDKTSIKGHSFEDVIHDVVSGLVAQYGDLAEQTGDTVGVAANRKGDEVVTLNEEDTRGAEAAYVLEAKTGSKGLKAMLGELDAAMENRDAEAAIAVFSCAENAPTSVPFFANGDKAIVVFDPDELDTTALRLATMWARWVVRRKLADDDREFDVDAVADLIDEASRALTQHATIKGCHTAARRKIDEAGRHVDDLVGEIEGVLERLRTEIEGE